MKRVIKNLKLEAANRRKLEALDELTVIYVLAVQRFVNLLIAPGDREPDKFGAMPFG